MTVTDHADSARAKTGGVRVCENCGRPVTALDKAEYTEARARLIVERGLCVCPEESPAGGPSLI